MVTRADVYPMEQFIEQYLKDNLRIQISFNHEYGSGSSKKLEVGLYLDGKKIDSDQVYIQEGESDNSHW